jgi:hypothetical protein
MLMRCLDAVLPQRREAVTERLGLLGEQPSGKALRRRHMGALALYDRRGEPERQCASGWCGPVSRDSTCRSW